MRRLGLSLLATTALVTLSAEALAGSSAAKPPHQVPAPAFDPWTGWYAGVNVGGSWGRAQSDFAMSAFAAPVGASDSVSPDGVIGGGQLGYNWRADPNWLLGVETDIQGSGERASSTRFDAVDLEGVTTSYTAKLEWFGTARGRVGYVFDPGTLVYATGGLAYGRVSVSGTSHDQFGVNNFGTTSFANGVVNAGWTAGGGIEHVAWDPRWTWKLEYLYLDLGPLNWAVTAGAVRTSATTRFTDQIVRGGLNFHF